MMFACTCRNSGTRMWAMLARDPVSKLSTQITRWPRLSSSSQRCDPRNPAPPVTRQVAMSAGGYRPLSGARGLERLLADAELDQVVALVLPEREAVVGEPLADDRALLAARLGLAAALLGLDELVLRHEPSTLPRIVRGP